MKTDNDAIILLVEDDRVDILSVQRALRKINISNPLPVACTGARTGVEAPGMKKEHTPCTTSS